MLTVLCAGNTLSPRCRAILDAVTAERDTEVLTSLTAPLQDKRILFVVSLDESGINPDHYATLAYLRTRTRDR